MDLLGPIVIVLITIAYYGLRATVLAKNKNAEAESAASPSQNESGESFTGNTPSFLSSITDYIREERQARDQHSQTSYDDQEESYDENGDAVRREETPREPIRPTFSFSENKDFLAADEETEPSLFSKEEVKTTPSTNERDPYANSRYPTEPKQTAKKSMSPVATADSYAYSTSTVSSTHPRAFQTQLNAAGRRAFLREMFVASEILAPPISIRKKQYHKANRRRP